MTNKQRICSDCERTLACHECKYSSEIIPVRESIDIVTFYRLRGEKPPFGIVATK